MLETMGGISALRRFGIMYFDVYVWYGSIRKCIGVPGEIAQMVEQLVCNEKVPSSTLGFSTLASPVPGLSLV